MTWPHYSGLCVQIIASCQRASPREVSGFCAADRKMPSLMHRVIMNVLREVHAREQDECPK